MSRHLISRIPLFLLPAMAAGVVLVSCAPLEIAAPPVSSLALPKGADARQLEAGRAIYASACVRCHGPARIDRRSDAKWSQSILPRMCRKAKLTPEQTEALRAYVLTARKAGPTRAGE